MCRESVSDASWHYRRMRGSFAAIPIFSVSIDERFPHENPTHRYFDDDKWELLDAGAVNSVSAPTHLCKRLM